MVLFVERQLAPPVRLVGGRRRGCGGPSAKVHDLDCRREQNATPSRTDRGAEVDVFGVHEVPLVEEAGGTMVSLFKRRRTSPAAARIPVLLARAKPVFSHSSITRTPGCLRAAAALPSREELSTTMISWAAAGGVACNDSRQRSRSARA